jgi:hypothetical protein
MNSTLVTLIVILIATAASYGDQKHLLKLCGRWKSNVAETGYWIIDRYPNGTCAEKRYIDADDALPGEITLNWGKWSASHRMYETEILGTSTVLFSKIFERKIHPSKVLTETPESFEYEVADGTWTETRLNDQTPLLKLMPLQPRFANDGLGTSLRQNVAIS